MATLSALKFPTAEGAIEAFLQVEDLQKQSLIKLHDAAVVTWPAGRESPKLKHLVARGLRHGPDGDRGAGLVRDPLPRAAVTARASTGPSARSRRGVGITAGPGNSNVNGSTTMR